MRVKLVNKVLITIMAVIAILAFKNIKVEAVSSATITASKETVEVGDNVKINLSFTAAAWNLKISGSGINADPEVGYSQDSSEETKQNSYDLDTSKAGTYTIKLTGDITDKDGNTKDVNSSVTVVVNEKKVEEPTPTPEPTPEPMPEPEVPVVTKSNNANLKNLGIKPLTYDFHNFVQNRTSYTASVPYNVTSVTTYFEKADSKSTIKITGGSGLSVGKIANSEAVVSNLKVGLNNITITVTAEDGTVKTYKIAVTRQEEVVEEPEEPEEPEENNTSVAGLKSLTITGITLNPEFSPEIYEYTATLTEDKKQLDIKTESVEAEYKVTIAGHENLKEGENLINIIVYDKNDTVVSIYQVNVNKNIAKPEQINEVDSDTNKTSTPKITIILLLFVLIVIAVIIYVILHIETEKEDDEATQENTAKEYNNFEDEEFKLDTNEIFKTEEVENVKPEKKKGKHF